MCPFGFFSFVFRKLFIYPLFNIPQTEHPIQNWLCYVTKERGFTLLQHLSSFCLFCLSLSKEKRRKLPTWLCPVHHPLLSWDPVCWPNKIIGLSRFMSPCPASCVLYVPHHTSVRKNEFSLFREENQLSFPLKWNHMYLFDGKSSKGLEGHLKDSGHLPNPPVSGLMFY